LKFRNTKHKASWLIRVAIIESYSKNKHTCK
jgi:hypothetical protein